jgi:glucosylceramidase
MRTLISCVTSGTDVLRPGAPAVFKMDDITENKVVNLYPDVRFQTFLGFGSAFTETSALNYARLSPDRQTEAIRALFDKDRGLGYRFCRMHIGSCDFSTREYAYVEPGDTALKTFDLGQDRKYILPMVKQAAAAGDGLFLFASPWSPPPWMKTNGDVRHGGKVLDKYKDTWALYVVKYLLAYREEGIVIRAISIQNEPKAIQTWESCEYSALDEAEMISGHLAPALAKHGLGDIKIIIWDHNKERVYERARDTLADPAVHDRVWGIGYHWYSGGHFDALAMTAKAFPDKPLIETEFCTGFGKMKWNSYAHEILRNLNNGMAASVDWNMIVDTKGGPYHYRRGGCDAVLSQDAGSLEYRSAYAQVAQFSRYIRPGDTRIGSSTFTDGLPVTAFAGADGTITAVLLNETAGTLSACVRLEGESATVTLAPRSICTAVIR